MKTDADRALAQAALQYRLISPEQLAQAEAAHAERGGPLGAVLLEMGLMTREQLDSFEAFQRQQSGPSAPATPATSADLETSGQGPLAQLHRILTQAAQWGASDIHVHGGARLKVRLAGTLRDVGREPLPHSATAEMLNAALTDTQREVLEQHGEIDLAYTIPNVARFRVNVYQQQRGLDGIFRVVPLRPPTLADLQLPELLATFTQYHQGLVLLTGPSGCGKSATMAALVNLINEQRSDHVLSIEDPIECLHTSKRAIVNQRQVGRHTGSFARALRAALREDPDVIAIGELRDLETISLALSAAETGHLVLGTLHTDGAIRTIDRLIGVFPPNQQSQIRTMISESLRAIVSQRLVATVDGKSRIPAVEILIVSKAISNLIREGRTFQIQDAIQIGGAAGMCLLDQSLTKLIQAGLVSREEAARHATDPKRIGGGA